MKEVQVRVTYTLKSMERVTCEDSEKKQAFKVLTLWRVWMKRKLEEQRKTSKVRNMHSLKSAEGGTS